MKRQSRGFTILEVLVVVAIIAILSAIAIFAYNTAMTRARQRRTMADMRSIAMAWEARAGEEKHYNAAGFTMPSQALTHAEVTALLTPNYIKTVPAFDGWGNAFVFAVNQTADSGEGASEYAIRSAGADGQFDETLARGPFSDPDTDIVFSSGAFVTYPEAVQ